MAYKQTGKRTVNSILNELIERTNSDSRRLRLLEQNNSIHKTRINILEKELLGMKKSYLKVLNDFEAKLENQNVQIVKIQNYIKENDILEEVKDLAKWTRLYGGGGMVINTTGKSDKPLNVNSINENTPLSFEAAD